MKNKKISFIGAGNMGTAILVGIIKKGLISPNDIKVFDIDEEKLKNLEHNYGINTVKNIEMLFSDADIVILAIKPNKMDEVLRKVVENIKSDTIVISIAAGVTIEKIESILGDDKKIARVMPNTPALVAEAMTSISANKNMNNEDSKIVASIFNSLGKTEFIDEYLVDVVTGLSGSGPAYVYMFIEALADGAVSCGMPRSQAYKFAAQTVLGSAKMMLETAKHPGELKDMVASPGGTTIAGIRKLESLGLRTGVVEAVIAATEKSRELN